MQLGAELSLTVIKFNQILVSITVALGSRSWPCSRPLIEKSGRKGLSSQQETRQVCPQDHLIQPEQSAPEGASHNCALGTGTWHLPSSSPRMCEGKGGWNPWQESQGSHLLASAWAVSLLLAPTHKSGHQELPCVPEAGLSAARSQQTVPAHDALYQVLELAPL